MSASAWTIFNELALAVGADHTAVPSLTHGGADLSGLGQVHLGLTGGPSAHGVDHVQMVLEGFDDGGEDGQTMSDWLERWRVYLVGYGVAQGSTEIDRWLASYRLAEATRYAARRYFLEGPGTAYELAKQWVVESVQHADLHALMEAPHGHWGVFAMRLRFDLEVS